MGSRPTRTRAVLAGVAGAALVWAGSCNAEVVTVGTALPMPPREGFGVTLVCNSCVLTSPSVPNGVSDISPVNGMVIRWHLNKSASEAGSSYRLRVLARYGEEYVAAGRSAPVSPAHESAVETFPAHLPIQAGQLIGLELENSQSQVSLGSSTGAESALLEPAIPDGTASTPPTWWDEAGWSTGAIFPFNAEILPTPTITNISPAKGPPVGGNVVAIAGTNFAEVMSVSFGSAEAIYTIDSEAELTATVPAGVEGSSVPVSVVTAAGRAEAAVDYNYEPESPPTGAGNPAPSGCLVPRLKGRRLPAVKRMLRRANCRLGQLRKGHRVTTRSGRVKKQSPAPGTSLPSGGKVVVALRSPH